MEGSFDCEPQSPRLFAPFETQGKQDDNVAGIRVMREEGEEGSFDYVSADIAGTSLPSYLRGRQDDVDLMVAALGRGLA